MVSKQGLKHDASAPAALAIVFGIIDSTVGKRVNIIDDDKSSGQATAETRTLILQVKAVWRTTDKSIVAIVIHT